MTVNNDILKIFGDYVIKAITIDNIDYIEVSKDKLKETIEYLTKEYNLHYITSIGVDDRPLTRTLRVYHVFSRVVEDKFIVIGCSTDPHYPHVDSITPVVPAANWAEREIRDLLGIKFRGHPNLERLVLPDDWPEDIHPLRKDVPYNLRSVVEVKVTYPLKRPREHTVLPVGPYHPLLHEPEYFELYVDGEKVVDVEYRGFHVHRGIEKLGESRLTYNQVPFVAERICGICGFTHSTCYCQAVEKAMKIHVPERAGYIRSILLELERMHSHLLWIGVACHLLGFDTGFMHSWRIREHIMRLCERLTGNRKTYGLNLIGGVRRDINKDGVKKAINVLKMVKEELKRFIECLLSLKEVKARLEGTGILPKNDAWKLGAVGPTLRASGIKYDVRANHPYAAYKEASFSIPVYTEGDNLARLLIRIDETLESISIIEQLLDKIPKGDILAKDIEVHEGKIGLSMTEAPRGENIHFVITGKDNILYRWKVRAPTYANLPVLKVMLKECPLSDAPITIASIDPCFSCTDRVIVIDIKNGVMRVTSFKRLLRCKI